MKKIILVLMLCLVSFSFAGQFGLYQVAPTLGVIIPEDPFDMGFQVGAKANVGSLMDGKIGLYPVLNYWRTGAENFDDYTLSNIKLGVDFHYDLNQYFQGLYAGAGLAMNIVKSEFTVDYGPYYGGKQSYDDSNNEFGFCVFGGYNFEMSGKPLFVEAKYDLINNLNTLGVKVGMFFDMKK